MTWIVCILERNGEWKQIGTTGRPPDPELVPKLLREGHLPSRHQALYSDEGLEVRFIPVGGGAPVSFRASYELVVTPTTVEAADAARLPDLDDHTTGEFGC